MWKMGILASCMMPSKHTRIHLYEYILISMNTWNWIIAVHGFPYIRYQAYVFGALDATEICQNLDIFIWYMCLHLLSVGWLQNWSNTNIAEIIFYYGTSIKLFLK